MSQVAWNNFEKNTIESFVNVNTVLGAKYVIMMAIVSLALGMLHCSNCFIMHHDYYSILSFNAIEKGFFIGYMSTGGGLCILALFLETIGVWKRESYENYINYDE